MPGGGAQVDTVGPEDGLGQLPWNGRSALGMKFGGRRYCDIWCRRRHILELRRRRLRRCSRRRGRSPRRCVGTHPLLAHCRQRLRGAEFGRRNGQIVTIAMPATFSFLRDPDGALDVLATLAQLSGKLSVTNLNIDHSACREMDLAASVCLDLLTIWLGREWRSSSRLLVSGHVPHDERIRRMYRGCGLTKHLRVAGQQLHDDEQRKILVFPLRSGRKSVRPTSSTEVERACDSIVDYVNSCLQTQAWELTADGRSGLSELVGEVLVNAEEHSGLGGWWVISYMDQSSGIGECFMAIVSFGNTIYDSIGSTGTPPYVRNELLRLADAHERRGFFVRRSWRREDLWTLYALQDGVSRFNDGTITTDRGVGTIKLIEWFQKIGGTDRECRPQEMAIVSGDTYIYFDGKYRMSSRSYGNEVRQVIAFNSTNDLELRPDGKYVKQIDNYFPGTIISIRFFIDNAYIMRRHSNDGGRNV